MIYDILPVNSYEGNNSNKDFDFDFYIDNENQLKVFLFDKNNIKIELKNGVDYSISGVKNEKGGSITFPIESSSFSTLDNGEFILLELTLPVSQELEYNNSSNLNPKELEYSFDYLTRLIQILKNKLSLCLKVEQCANQTPDELMDNINQSCAKAVIAAQDATNFAEIARESKNSAQNAALVVAETLKDTLNTSQITNCITEIPQNIKLDLTDGVLTLKAGSKVIVPNGFEEDGTTPRFDEIVIEDDLTSTWNSGAYTLALFFYPSTTEIGAYAFSANASGNVEPTTNSNFYNTSTNTVYRYNGSTKSKQLSFPLAIVTSDADDYVSIDQTFNGIGYIGSTIWVDKGVKCLIPNGRNEDGSLKNIEWTNDVLRVRNYSNANKSVVVALRHPQDVYYNDFPLNITETYMPSGSVSYLTKENIWRAHTGSDYYNMLWMLIGSFQTDASGVISNFQPKQPFRAVDYNDFNVLNKNALLDSDQATITGWAFPSNTYKDFTLGASGATYTAPADGWLYFSKYSNAAAQYINIGWSSSNLQINNYAAASGQQLKILAPFKKGEKMRADYNAGGDTNSLRFFYAKGVQ